MNDMMDLIPLKKQVDDIKNRYTYVPMQLINTSNIEAKTDADYEYLVLSGGGIRGIAFTGALETLLNYGIKYEKLKGIAGVSAGSIVAALLAIGYTPKDLIKIMSEIDFGKLANDGYGYVGTGLNFIRSWGTCPGNYVIELLGKLIKDKTGNPDYTLEDLKNDTGIRLIILANNASYSITTYLYAGNPEPKYSKIPIRIAIRMSMSIPYLFEPYSYNDCLFVDGGLLCRYPINSFDAATPDSIEALHNLCPPNPKVLGLKLMTDDLTPDYQMTKKHEFTGLLDYSMSFINMFLLENDRHVMVPSFWDRTIVIITKNYPLNKFDLENKEKLELIEAGRKYTDVFFN